MIPSTVVAMQPTAMITSGPTQQTVMAYGDMTSPINYTVGCTLAVCEDLVVGAGLTMQHRIALAYTIEAHQHKL